MNVIQLALFPPPRNWWPAFIRQAMREANTYGSNFGWSPYCNPFYSFKDKLLARHGSFLGYNIQRIVISCNRCNGTGNFLYWTHCKWDKCLCCNGTGKYRKDYHILERYNLFGDIYHKPIRLVDVKRLGALGHLIKGKIEHKTIRPARAWSSFLILLFFFDHKIFRREFWRIAGNFTRRFYIKFNRTFDKLAAAFAEVYKYQFHYDQFGGLPF